MDVFASYVDADELREDEAGEEPVAETSGAGTSQYDPGSLLPVSVDLAPSVAPILGMGAFAKAESKEVAYNPKAETLYASVQGPAALPPGMFRNGVNNTPTGHVERTNLNHFLFDQQYHTFHSYGFAADPTISAHPQSFVGSAERMQSKGAATVYGASSRQRKKLPKQKRKESGDPGTDEYLGPWAPPADEKPPQQLTEEQVAEYEAWKPISKKKRKQMERQAMLAEEGEGDEEQQEGSEAPKKEKKKKKKKEKKNIETVFEDEGAPRESADDDEDSDDDGAESRSAPPPSRVGPARPPPPAASTGDDDDDDDDDGGA